MAVIIFSRKFPSYHPKAGKPTEFVEQILNTLGIEYWEVAYLKQLEELNDFNAYLVGQIEKWRHG